MNSTPRFAPFARFARFAQAPVAALTLALAACGGGTDEAALPQAQAQAQQVRLEGCVVDEHYIPRTGTAVRLLGPDGRLLGHATSDKDGRFTLQVPARQVVSLNVDKEGGETLAVPTGQGTVSVEMCLRDTTA